MESRKIALFITACTGVAILGVALRHPAVPTDIDGDRREAKSNKREVSGEAFATERKANRQARETLKDDPSLNRIWIKDSAENTWLNDLLTPFNPSELRQMIDSGDAESWPLAELISRAAAGKHPGFQDLLEREDLRKDPRTDMALCAYDYSVNGKREALERILATHRAAGSGEEPSWTDPAAQALRYVNEWDLTREALGAHPMAHGESDYDGPKVFWLTRRYLFPRNQDLPTTYEAFGQEILR
jgi:hypothetical protein